MRKITKTLLLLLGLLIGSFGVRNEKIALAIGGSGACSSHNGVYCAAGPDYDGSAICNDGWADSSVNYWYTSECREYFCTEQQILWDALYSTRDWSIGTSSLCDELGINGIGSLETCIEIRTAELETQYDQLFQTVDSVRYTCSGYSTSPISNSDSSTNNTPSNDEIFSDVPSTHQYSEAINALYESGVIEGYSDGTYKPENPINRAEFVKILIGWTDTSPFDGLNWTCFTDVEHEDWYAKYVFIAKSMGYIEGYPDGSFGASNYINIAEALKITGRYPLFWTRSHHGCIITT